MLHKYVVYKALFNSNEKFKENAVYNIKMGFLQQNWKTVYKSKYSFIGYIILKIRRNHINM